MAKKLEERSSKSREEFAKSLIILANTIHGAIFVAFLVLPLSVSMTSYMMKGQPPFSSLDDLNKFLDWLQLPFIVFVFASVVFGVALKNRAMNILDKLEDSDA